MSFIRSDIPHRRRWDLEGNGSSNHGVEQMIIELQIYQKENWFLCGYYKPPRVKDHEFEKVFVETCYLLQTESNHLLLIGDMNFNMVVENKLSELCRLYDLKNLVKGPTCYKGETPSAVDVIISNEPLRFQTPLILHVP